MMKIFPYERLKITTKLSPDEAINRLVNVIELQPYLRWFATDHKPYEGKVEGHQFQISRVINYRNSFLPMIHGEVLPEMRGSSIRITMRSHGLVIVFMIFWLGAVGFFFLAMLSTFISAAMQGTIGNPSVLLAPAGMFAFGYLLMLGGFKFESIKSKKFFCDLFEAEEVEESGILNPFEVSS